MFSKKTDPNRELFLQEEFKGDRLINNIRFFLVFVFAGIAVSKSGILEGNVTISFQLTVVSLSIALIYSTVLFFLYRKNIYHPAIKFVSVTIDVTLIIMAIYAYKFDPYEEYATIYFLGRHSILFIFIILSIIRYSFRLSVYMGLIGALEYYFFVIMNNHMNDLEFTFLGKDGITYTSKFVTSEANTRVIYIFIAGLVAGIAAIILKKIIANSIAREQEKNELEMKNTVVEAINNENKKYLENISDGLLLIDRDYIINNQYSSFLTDIFETDKIGGKNFIDLIFPDKKKHIKSREDLEEFLSILFSNTTSELSMIMDINPIVNTSIMVKNDEGKTKEKIITATYHRIMNNENIENIMVIIEDITKLYRTEKELEEQKQKHKTEIEMISNILKIGPETLYDFLNESDTILNEVETNLEKLDNEYILNESFRNMHSLKGSARSLGFVRISELAHKIEDLLSALRDSQAEYNYQMRSDFIVMISQIFREFQNINELNDRFKSFSTASAEDTESKNKLSSFMESLKEMTQNIAEEQDKDIEFKITNHVSDIPFLVTIKDPVIHLIRNAIDHGIEDKFERLTAKKSEKALIELTMKKDGNIYVISVKDDGKGIDFDDIKKKAIEKKIIKNNEISKAKLLSILFLPAFSSREKVSELSGRGVGLDIVKTAADKLKGKISVISKKGKGTVIILKIPVS